MTLKEFAESFNIFAKYNEDNYLVYAEHDIIYVLIAPNDILIQEDLHRLLELEWSITDDKEGFEHFV